MGTINNPKSISKGKVVKFDKTSADNYFSFTIDSPGNVVLASSYSKGEDSDYNFYDDQFNYIGRYFGDGSTTKELTKSGTYYIHASNSKGGSFSIATSNENILAKSISKGKVVKFDKTSADNYFSFTIDSPGNVVLASSYSKGEDSDYNFYDDQFNYIGRYFGDGSTTKELTKSGTYYIHASNSKGGSFSIATSNENILAKSISKGKVVKFDKTSADNYFSFTIDSPGNVVLASSYSKGEDSDYNFYDDQFNYIGRYFGDGSTTKELTKSGTYYIHASNSKGGSFSIATSNENILAKSISKGKVVKFDKTSADNYFSFTIDSPGNVVLASSYSKGEDSDYNFYDDQFNYIGRYFGDGSTTKELTKSGTYYIHASNSKGGSFSIATSNENEIINLLGIKSNNIIYDF